MSRKPVSSRWLRAANQTAFWHLAPRRLVVAVLARSAEEPVLLSCAMVAVQSQLPASSFAAGVIEAARAVCALRLDNVVALDDPYCRLVSADSAGAESVPVAGRTGMMVQAAATTVTSVVDLFADAQLRLVAIDSAECARISLAEFLGSDGDASVQSSLADPLAAVTVLPECETVASELASLLAVPVGAALSWYRLVGCGDG